MGSEEYNQRLSQRRAHAVRECLVAKHGIDAKRLLDTGIGKQQPIDGAVAAKRPGRRVQFHGA